MLACFLWDLLNSRLLMCASHAGMPVVTQRQCKRSVGRRGVGAAPSRRRSLGMTIRVSTASRSAFTASDACRERWRPSKENGIVTMPTCAASRSLARCLDEVQCIAVAMVGLVRRDACSLIMKLCIM